jgi:hypothetical protein
MFSLRKRFEPDNYERNRLDVLLRNPNKTVAVDSLSGEMVAAEDNLDNLYNKLMERKVKPRSCVIIGNHAFPTISVVEAKTAK